MDLMTPLEAPAFAEPDAARTASDWSFVLAAREARLFTEGMTRRLRPGGADTLGERVRGFFDEVREGGQGPALLVGALPFDRSADDFLFQPTRKVYAPTAAPWPPPPGGNWSVTPEPGVEGYKAAVAAALGALTRQDGGLAKVVLARSLKLTADRPIDVDALAARLAGDPGAVRFTTPVGRRADGLMKRLTGASPELLIARKGAAVSSNPLAGSARRSRDTAADQAAAKGLEQSDKDHREHALVVEAILDILAPYCSDLAAPQRPELIGTATMWHLGTRIEGRLKRPEQTSAAELAAALHPTPAVAGAPRQAATDLIHRIEGYERGFYAGAVGWTDMAGDGVWYVSLRCAETAGAEARLYAGAGVVEGSTPEGEAAETSAKFQAMLRAFGIDEAGRPLDQGA